MDEEKAKMLEDQILDEVNASMKELFARFLVILEDLQEEHRSTYCKLLEAIPAEYHPILYTADYFDERKMQWLRKRILDIGNEIARKNKKNCLKYTVKLMEFKFKEN